MGLIRASKVLAMLWVGLSAFGVANACGSSESSGHGTSDDGAGGGGGAGARATTGGQSGTGSEAGGAGGQATRGSDAVCGGTQCDALDLPFPDAPPVSACCPDGEEVASCGLDSSGLEMLGVSFEDPCQPLDQPGEADEACPDSPSVSIPDTPISGITFVGCCREETHSCGYLVNDVLGILQVGLGCVDSAPFLDGGAPESCESSAGGAGGAAGGGAGGASN